MKDASPLLRPLGSRRFVRHIIW